MPKATPQTQSRGGGKPAAAPSRAAPPPRQQSSRSLISTNDDQLPAHLQGYVGQGMEQMGTDDLARPRLKLIQSNSPELQEYNSLRPGDFLHTSAGFILQGPFLVTPIFVAKRFLLWNPREDGGGILARSDDGVTWSPPNASFDVKLDKKDGGGRVTWKTAPRVDESGLAEWGTMNPTDPNSPPAATKMYDYLFAFPEHPDLEPAVFSFQRSSWKVGRNLNTNIKTAIARWPIFTLAYALDSVDDNNASNQDFKNVTFTNKGHITDPDLIENYRAVRDSLVDPDTGRPREGAFRVRDEESLQAEADRMGSEEREPVRNPNDLRRGRR